MNIKSLLAILFFFGTPISAFSQMDLIKKSMLKNEKTTFRQLPKPDFKASTDSLSYQNAIDDATMFDYIVMNGYSGYKYWKNSGFDIASASQIVEKKFKGKKHIASQELFSVYASMFNGINDGHVSINGKNLYFSPFRHRDAFFSDILIERRDDGFFIIQSEVFQIECGQKYTGPDSLLFRTLSPKGREHFLIGKLSTTPIYRMTASFDNQEKTIPLHRCRISMAGTSNGKIFSSANYEGIKSVRLATLMSTENDSALVKFAESGKEFALENKLILDLTHNGGGNSEYIQNFFKHLNNTYKVPMNYAVLKSPATAQSMALIDTSSMPALKKYALLGEKEVQKQMRNPKIKWEISSSLKQKKGNFKGDLYVIMNRANASSAEMGIAIAKQIPTTLLIGENSAGINSFGNISRYQLPYSKFTLNLPYCIYEFTEFKNGQGYMPDYWLDSYDPIKETTSWLKNNESYRFNVSAERVPTDMTFEKSLETFTGKGEWSQWGLTPVQKKGQESNKIIIETVDGNNLLSFISDEKTNLFNAAYTLIPLCSDKIEVTLDVVSDLKKGLDNTSNAFIGFIKTNRFGQKSYNIKKIGENDNLKDIKLVEDLSSGTDLQLMFVIYCTKQGKLSVDNIRFKTL